MRAFGLKARMPIIMNSSFLSGFLNKQLYSKINRGVRDDGLLNLTGKDFYSCIVPVPPIAEQKKIAEILAQCDKVIALKQERLEAEIVRKKWLMNQLLHHPENYRVPGYGGDWKTSTIGSVTSSFFWRHSYFFKLQLLLGHWNSVYPVRRDQ